MARISSPSLCSVLVPTLSHISPLSPVPLSTIWSKSTVAYVYAAAKGYSSGYPVEKDTVVVEVYALRWTESGFTEERVGTIIASDGFVDNALEPVFTFS